MVGMLLLFEEDIVVSSSTRAEVLIVEDRMHTAEKLRKSVGANPDICVCGVAYNVESALNFLNAKKPRIVLTDLGLPDGSGIEVIQAAKVADWPCDSIVVSIFGDEQRVFEALRAGAKGYIQKNDTAANIGNCILDLIDGGSPMSPKIARLLLSVMATSTATPQTLDGKETLSNRETEVMVLIAQGYRRQEVGEKLSITVGTVGNHIHRIYSKLGVNSNTAAIVEATKQGLL